MNNPGPCFPTITEAEFAEFQRLRALNAELVTAMQELVFSCQGKRPASSKHNECPRAPHWTFLDNARAALAKAGA